jgi:hypothetical protein
MNKIEWPNFLLLFGIFCIILVLIGAYLAKR